MQKEGNRPNNDIVDQKNSKIQTFKKFIGVKLHSHSYLRIASRYLFSSLAGQVAQHSHSALQ